jgi:hypothetical protein
MITSKITAINQAGVLGMLYISALVGDGLSVLSPFGLGGGNGGGGATGLGVSSGLKLTSLVTALGVGMASRSPHLLPLSA